MKRDPLPNRFTTVLPASSLPAGRHSAGRHSAGTRFTAILLAVTLSVVVLAGCTVTAGDAAACRTFERAVRAEQSTDSADLSNGMTALSDGARRAGLEASSTQLRTHLTHLATGSTYTDPVLRDLDFTINFLEVGRICEAEGVSLGAYEETENYLAGRDMSLEDLVTLRETLKDMDATQDFQAVKATQDLEDPQDPQDPQDPWAPKDPVPFADADLLGDAREEASKDAGLLALHEQCGAGQMRSCDTLSIQAPMGSKLEEFGMSCGGQKTGGNSQWCWELEGVKDSAH